MIDHLLQSQTVQAIGVAIITTLVKEYGARISDAIKNNIKGKISKNKIDVNEAFEKYLQQAVEKYSKIKTLVYHNRPTYLYDFYEPINLKLNQEVIETSDISNVLDISHFILITGTGGIGKSTMLKHFFLNSISTLKFVPLFIELRDIRVDDLEEHIYKSLCNNGFSLEKQFFFYALDSGCFLFLLDGYDEIPHDRREKLYHELSILCDRYPQNYYIVSSRPSEEFISWQRFTELESKSLAKEQAISLVKKTNFDKDTKEKFLASLSKNLYDSHKAFASNPLLLCIMLLTYCDYADIPSKLHVFYECAYNTLFSKHDATKEGLFKRETSTNLSPDIFKKILASFSFYLYFSQKYEFSERNMQDAFEHAIVLAQNIGVNLEAICDIESKDFITDLIDCVCLIYKDGTNFRFIHRSFQEYFACIYIYESNDNMQANLLNEIYKKTISLSTDNVYSMLFEMSRMRLESNFILPNLDKYFSYSGNKTVFCISLLFRMFDTVDYDKSEIIKSFSSRKNRIVAMISDRELYSFFSLVTRLYHLYDPILSSNYIIAGDSLDAYFQKHDESIELAHLSTKSRIYKTILAYFDKDINALTRILDLHAELKEKHERINASTLGILARRV